MLDQQGLQFVQPELGFFHGQTEFEGVDLLLVRGRRETSGSDGRHPRQGLFTVTISGRVLGVSRLVVGERSKGGGALFLGPREAREGH